MRTAMCFVMLTCVLTVQALAQEPEDACIGEIDFDQAPDGDPLRLDAGDIID